MRWCRRSCRKKFAKCKQILASHREDGLTQNLKKKMTSFLYSAGVIIPMRSLQMHHQKKSPLAVLPAYCGLGLEMETLMSSLLIFSLSLLCRRTMSSWERRWRGSTGSMRHWSALPPRRRSGFRQNSSSTSENPIRLPAKFEQYKWHQAKQLIMRKKYIFNISLTKVVYKISPDLIKNYSNNIT